MQAYGKDFASIYNIKWQAFIKQVAPYILDFYNSTETGQGNKPVLDLCCGTGQLAVYFLERGYRVTGIDLSNHMLHYARENAGKYIESGQACFMNADAGDFSVAERFGLVVSTYDALNHLESKQTLANCFKCVYDVCEGYFIFDLNTKRGLKNWNGIHVNEHDDDTLIITRGIYDEQSDKAWTKFTGFTLNPDGSYNRFDETVYNTAFDMDWVRETLLTVGWKDVRFAKIQNLDKPLNDPESEPRVFVVVSK